MKKPKRGWTVRVSFEPNRFAAEKLANVYEQINPIDAYSLMGTEQQSETLAEDSLAGEAK